MRHSEAHRAGGFTLLELILATTLTVLIVGAAYESYVGSLKSAKAGSTEIDMVQSGRAVLSMIADDLRSATLTPGGGVFGFGLRGTDGDDAQYESDTLELCCTQAMRWRNDPTGISADPLPPRMDLRRITYRVITPEEAAEQTTDPGIRPALGLVRQVRINLLNPDGSDQMQQAISRRVLSLQIQYYDSSAGWVDTWSAGGSAQMPVAVKVTVMLLPREEDLVDAWGQRPEGLTLAEMYPRARTFTTAVSLPTAVPDSGTRIIQ